MSTQILENRFEIEKQLSHSDFSSVYLACDRHHLHRPHCIVTAVNYRDAEMRHRLEREAHVLERLGQHPQIPRVLAYFHRSITADASSPNQRPEKQAFYVIHDQVIGHPLSKEITPSKQLSASYVAKLLQDVLVPLSFAHRQGIIHQNIHPQHLIRQDRDGTIFLTKFGTLPKLARSILGSDGTLSSSVPVSPHPYTAPEQLQQTPQPASDLYALGLIAIEALTGKRHHNFTYDPNRGLLWRDELEHQNVDLPLPLAEFIDRLIRHDWQDRFAHATEALNTLKAQNSRHKIANDSDLPTVVAAPAMNLSLELSADDTYLPPVPDQEVRNTKPHKIKPANPYLYKIGAGSIAALLALGIGVKAFQWGEYRLSTLPRTWHEWKHPTPPSYTAANVSTLTPLMADGSILLKPAAAEAFWRMVAAAQADEIQIYPLSGYRALLETQPAGPDQPAADDEEAIEVRTNREPLRQSVPTTAQSDYVTGYALDIGGEIADWDKQKAFANTKTFKWLVKNAKQYGFELSLPKGKIPGSVSSDEPWHWRYVGDSQSQEVFGVKDR
ncbi:MAG: D-alanyl-D-alanine carboxypeptidase family protein [Cyanobacteria bacterium P01_F01_bin.53]